MSRNILLTVIFCLILFHQVKAQVYYDSNKIFIGENNFKAIIFDDNHTNSKDHINLNKNKLTSGNFVYQYLVSQGLGLVYGLSYGFLFYTLKPDELIATGSYFLGFFIGQSLGIYWLASEWNENLKFYGILGYCGLGVSAALLYGKLTNWNDSWIAGLYFLPLFSSLLYANVFSVDNSTEQFDDSESKNIKTGYSFIDIMESEKQFNFEILRLNF